MLLLLVFAIDLLGPVCLLLLLKRWTRRLWSAFAGTVIATPGAAFFLTGGAAWLATYFHVVVGGDTSIPDREGWTASQYLSHTFVECGTFGVLFAGVGLGLALALWAAVEMLWRLTSHCTGRR
jgi:hypothetical protein